MEDASVIARHDVDAAALAVEHDLAVHQREQRIVPALADAFPGVEFGAKLPHQDVARDDLLSAETFDAAALAVRIAAVAAGALTFFMCHACRTDKIVRQRKTKGMTDKIVRPTTVVARLS